MPQPAWSIDDRVVHAHVDHLLAYAGPHHFPEQSTKSTLVCRAVRGHELRRGSRVRGLTRRSPRRTRRYDGGADDGRPGHVRRTRRGGIAPAFRLMDRLTSPGYVIRMRFDWLLEGPAENRQVASDDNAWRLEGGHRRAARRGAIGHPCRDPREHGSGGKLGNRAVLVDGDEPAGFDHITTGRAPIFTGGQFIRLPDHPDGARPGSRTLSTRPTSKRPDSNSSTGCVTRRRTSPAGRGTCRHHRDRTTT